ncbi:MAG: hypothetical protein ACTSQ5_09370 [Promethearchaeota archaeon]
MKQIPLFLLKIKKVYDIIIPTGKVMQDIDKSHNFNDIESNVHTVSPPIKDILATTGILAKLPFSY